MRKRLFWIVLLGFLIRAGVMFLDFSWDVNNHMSWAADLWDPRRGFRSFYDTISAAWFATKYPNYPPFSMYLFYALLPVQKLIENFVWYLNVTVPAFPSSLVFFVQSRVFAAGLFKLPSILADFGLAFVLYRFAERYRGRGSAGPLFAASAILLNPAFFYNSAYWGQIDAIPLLCAVCSVLLLIDGRRPVGSALLMTASLLFKPTTIIFVPFYAYFFLKKFGYKKLILSAVLSAVMFFISFIPFVPFHTIIPGSITLYTKNILMAQSLTFVTNGAFNLWSIIVGLKNISDSKRFLLNISYQQFGIFLSLIWVSVVTYVSQTIKKNSYRIPFMFALCALGTFYFLTRMHERYTILPLPFLIMAAVHNKKIVPMFWILSVISFLNLYKSWPVPRIELLFQLVSHSAGYMALAAANFFIMMKLLRKESAVKG